MSDLIERQVAIDDLHGRDPSQVWDTADIDVWVNALPSVQTEPCEDAISRQRLLNDLKELIVVWGKYPVMAEPIKGIGTAIGYAAAIPSVTPERKMGKWIKRDVSRQIHGISCSAPNYQCSVCKKWWFHNGEGLKWYKFCPNCGADMRSETE